MRRTMRSVFPVLSLLLFAALHPVQAVDTQRALCRALPERSAAVERLLRSVNDRETADRAAAALQGELEQLQQELRALAEHPATDEAAAQELARTMQVLLYMTQRYLPVVRRLEEVNGYGSEELITVLHCYKLTTARPEGAEEPEPMEQACADWAEATEETLYLLRRVQDASAAQEAALALPMAVEHLQNMRLLVQGLGHSAACGVHGSPAVSTHLERLREDLRREYARLAAVRFYGVPALRQWAEKAEQAAE